MRLLIGGFKETFIYQSLPAAGLCFGDNDWSATLNGVS